MKKYLPYILVGVAVYALRNRIGGLPIVNKIPAV